MLNIRISDDIHSAQMAAAQAGEARAYAALLRDCVPIISRMGRFRGVPADQLEDLVQDVLLTIHRSRAIYDPSRPFDAWLWVIVERRVVDLLRRTHRHGAREIYAPLEFERHVDPEADPERGLAASDGARRVTRVLSTLPERQREAVCQLVIAERSLSEAATATGRSKTALKVNLHRALKTLRAQINYAH
jgi:RNA polymerase sigma factor (sigma-70 family)